MAERLEVERFAPAAGNLIVQRFSGKVKRDGGVAQLGERKTGSLEAMGSIPITSINMVGPEV